MRGHYAVGYRQGKESREKGGGKRGECVDTMQWATVREKKVGRREKGGGKREECVDGALERAQRRGESWVCGAFRLSRL